MNDDDKDRAKLIPRPVRESISEMAEIVMPNDANPLNALSAADSCTGSIWRVPWPRTGIRGSEW